jgi:ADP-heptose:LPS heptosyltransferase
LQKAIPEGDRAVLRRHPAVQNHSAALTDFAETAALIEALDLVISIDTAVAHLAGGLGKPVWIMLPHVAEWRWLRDRGDSPWYPSARLFRQPAPGDWAGLTGGITTALSRAVASPDTLRWDQRLR